MFAWNKHKSRSFGKVRTSDSEHCTSPNGLFDSSFAKMNFPFLVLLHGFLIEAKTVSLLRTHQLASMVFPLQTINIQIPDSSWSLIWTRQVSSKNSFHNCVRNYLGIPLAQQPRTEENSDEDDELAEDGSRTATLFVIPDDHNSRKSLLHFTK